MVVVVNFVVDLLYAAIDPRIKGVGCVALVTLVATTLSFAYAWHGSGSGARSPLPRGPAPQLQRPASSTPGCPKSQRDRRSACARRHHLAALPRTAHACRRRNAARRVARAMRAQARFAVAWQLPHGGVDEETPAIRGPRPGPEHACPDRRPRPAARGRPPKRERRPDGASPPAPAQTSRAPATAASRFGGAPTLLLVAAATLSLVWTPWPTYDIDIPNKLKPPTAHWLGTDVLGRTSPAAAGRRAQLHPSSAWIAVGIGLVVGTALGLLSHRPNAAGSRRRSCASPTSLCLPRRSLSATHDDGGFGPGIVNSIIAIGISTSRPSPASRARRITWSGRAVRARGACRRQGRVAHHDRVTRAPQHRVGADEGRSASRSRSSPRRSCHDSGPGPPPQPSWGACFPEAQTLLFRMPRLAVFPGIAIARGARPEPARRRPARTCSIHGPRGRGRAARSRFRARRFTESVGYLPGLKMTDMAQI